MPDLRKLNKSWNYAFIYSCLKKKKYKQASYSNEKKKSNQNQNQNHNQKNTWLKGQVKGTSLVKIGIVINEN